MALLVDFEWLRKATWEFKEAVEDEVRGVKKSMDKQALCEEI